MSPFLPETIRRLWQPRGIYLDTASYGLPALPVAQALQAAVEGWRDGSAPWQEWNESVHRTRVLFAELAGTSPSNVSVGPNVSGMLGLVASCLPNGARVVAPDVDFASTLYPFLAQADRKVDVRTVPLERLADAVDASTDVVLFSAVQSSNGAIADIPALVSAARAVDALTVCDATHAYGWLDMPVDDIDVTVCAAYKWLMCPRGIGFMTVKPAHLEWIRPNGAGWFAKNDPYDGNYYGPGMDLARDARRLDTSPPWMLWPAAEVALQLLLDIGIGTIRAHDVALANRFRAGLGLEAATSAVVHVDAPGADEKLVRAGIVASVRAGKVRASFHTFNSPDDVDVTIDALTSS